jgi:hypothetical protein
LIYVFEFPFATKNFTENLKIQLEKKFPNRIRKENDFLRSANFNYKNFISDENVIIVYLLKKEELLKYEDYLETKFLEKLIKYYE